MSPTAALAALASGLLAALWSPGAGYLILPLGLALAAVLMHRIIRRRAGVGARRTVIALVLAGLGFIGAQARLMDTGLLFDRDPSSALHSYRLEGVAIGDPQRDPDGGWIEVRLDTLYEYIEGRLHQRQVDARVRLYFDAEDNLPSLRYGQRLRFEARLKPPASRPNPGAYNYSLLMKSRGVDGIGRLMHPEALEVLGEEPPSRFKAAVLSLRQRLLARMQSRFGEGSVLPALLLGDEGMLGREVRNAYRDAGLGHALVVSGLNLAISMHLFVWLLTRLLAWPPRFARENNPLQLAWLLALLPTALYAGLTGFNVPVQRALVMMTALAAAQWIERPPAPWNAFALAAILLLAVNPLAIADPSFLLSFGAVAVLLAVGGPLERHLAPRILPRFAFAPWLGRVLWAGVALVIATTAITLLTAPLMASYFDTLSPFSPLANLAALPVVNLVVLPMGLLGVVLEITHEGWGVWPWWLADAAGDWVTHAAFAFQRWNPDWPPMPKPAAPELLLLALAAAALALAWWRPWWPRWRWAAAFVIGLLSVFVYFHRPLPDGMRVTLLDVGQGESIVVESTQGDTLVIDTAGRLPNGEPLVARTLIPYFRHAKIRQVDAVFLTHAQMDHAGGTAELRQRYPNAPVYSSDPAKAANGWNEAARWMAMPLEGIQPVCGPSRLEFGALAVEVMNPPCDDPGLTHDPNPNNRSLVLRVCEGAACWLFTGDIEAPAEEALVRQYGDRLRTGALKVPHHGSRSSSSEAFLGLVRPAVAVLSAGANSAFGHPHAEVVERYQNAGIVLGRTDQDGAVAAEWDGRDWRMARFRATEGR